MIEWQKIDEIAWNLYGEPVENMDKEMKQLMENFMTKQRKIWDGNSVMPDDSLNLKIFPSTKVTWFKQISDIFQVQKVI